MFSRNPKSSPFATSIFNEQKQLVRCEGSTKAIQATVVQRPTITYLSVILLDSRHTDHVDVTVASYNKRADSCGASPLPLPLTKSPMSNERPTKRRRAFSGSDWDLGLPIPPRLLIKKHSEKGRVPTRGSTLAAGYDLYRLGISLLNYNAGFKLMHGSAQKRKLFQLGGKPSSIPRFPSRFRLAHTDASLREAALVSIT